MSVSNHKTFVNNAALTVHSYRKKAQLYISVIVLILHIDCSNRDYDTRSDVWDIIFLFITVDKGLDMVDKSGVSENNE